MIYFLIWVMFITGLTLAYAGFRAYEIITYEERQSEIVERLLDIPRPLHAIISDIEDTAQYCRSQGMSVSVDHGLPSVFVSLGFDHCGNERSYFFQEAEAQDLLDSVPDYVNEEDCILWLAQGW